MSADTYRIWSVTAPFTRHGVPVVGQFGASAQRVIIMTTETFKRLVREPGLATVIWEVGDLDA